MNISEQIRALRKLKGITQERLSEKAGLSRSMVGLYERGETSPSIYAVEHILDVLGYELRIVPKDD